MSSGSFHLPPPREGAVDLLIIAGEHSGDEHAAKLVKGLVRDNPGARVAALGGPCLEAAGAQLLYDMTASSVVGLIEVLRNFPFFRALFNETLRWISIYRPSAVCFVDYPGFNLRMAEALRLKGLTVKGGGAIQALYYISPQIWAWKPERRFSMARNLDAMAVIFPFEVECYADTHLPVEFVGHPFVAEDYTPPVTHDPKGPILLLPGSRKQAVARIFPVLAAGFAQFLKWGADHYAVVLYPSQDIRAVIEAAGSPSGVRLAPAGEPVAASAVLTSSGTMSMHCALAGIPGAIAYRTNPLTYLIARAMVRIRFLGIANLLLGEAMYPEYIQGRATPDALAAELESCVADPLRSERSAAQATQLRSLLSGSSQGTASDWLGRHLFPRT